MSAALSGLLLLDELTGGFKDGELIILGGRPGMGKTSFALRLLEMSGIEQKENCLMQSFETSSSLLARHLYALRTRFFCVLDKQEDEISAFRARYIDNGPVWIDDAPEGSLDKLSEKWRSLRAEHDLKFIIIDYLQLIVSPGGLNSCLSQLKAIAQELSLPIIVLAQLNRTADGRTDKRPIITDLCGIDDVEAVDKILFLYREDYYKNPEMERCSITEFILAKHPEGKTGTVKIPHFFTAEYFLLYDLYGEKHD